MGARTPGELSDKDAYACVIVEFMVKVALWNTA